MLLCCPQFLSDSNIFFYDPFTASITLAHVVLMEIFILGVNPDEIFKVIHIHRNSISVIVAGADFITVIVMILIIFLLFILKIL